jgi:methylmalonyl-CoA mutase cobalamin-binding subunit
MAEALLALEGCACVSLGVQTPVDALVQAAQAHRADVVALSASVAMPARQLNALCVQLRTRLAPEVDVWVGGDGSRPRRAAATPWQVLADLRDIAPAVRQWRTRATPPAAAGIDPAEQGTLTGC